ncbi:site-specific integrase [Dehalococcoidia bacterium]|nr:site-specific integrase [Dehalococcoidia bacterium]
MKGHIRKRSKGSWTLWIDLGRDPETGKRKQQTMTVHGTKRDAERELRATLTRLEEGAYVKPAKLTVGEYLNQWIESYVVTNTSPRTVEGYQLIVQRHLIPNLGTIPLTQLQPSHVQSYYAKALSGGRADGNGGLSARTVLHIHRVLSEALTHAVKWQILIRNVALAVDPPRPKRPEMTTLSEDQVTAFLQAVAGSQYRELFTVAVYTGMRRSELLGLRWKDVDLDLAQLSVTKTLHRTADEGFVFTEPKTAKSRRTIALSPSICILLRKLREHQIAEKLLLGLKFKDDDLVFSKPDGTHYDPSGVTHAFKRIVKRLGLPDVRLHDLRHTHASLMLKQGIHPKIVSERLGHSNIGITLDTYSHVMPGLQEAAALRFEEGLQGTSVRVSTEVG